MLFRSAAMAVMGKQTNRIPFSSSFPLDSIASSIRQYMTFAVLLTGNPVNALGKGIHGGNGVSIVINSKFIRCVPRLSLLPDREPGGDQHAIKGAAFEGTASRLVSTIKICQAKNFAGSFGFSKSQRKWERLSARGKNDKKESCHHGTFLQRQL